MMAILNCFGGIHLDILGSNFLGDNYDDKIIKISKYLNIFLQSGLAAVMSSKAVTIWYTYDVKLE
jgi:hypothetical protein